MSGSTTSQGFAFNRGQFQQIIDDTVAEFFAISDRLAGLAARRSFG